MKRLIGVALVASAIALAGCGSHHSSTPSLKLNAPSSVTPCTGAAYVMQCARNAPGQNSKPSPKLTLTLSHPLYGVDFAWASGPLGSTNWDFACSYLSNSSKDWRSSVLTSYASRRKGICFVWEVGAYPVETYNGGFNDAYRATREAAAYGYPHAHIFYAFDHDTSGDTAIRNYMLGAAAEERNVGGSAGFYGGRYTVFTACSLGLKPNWQTLAWTYGDWAPTGCAPLRQTAIDLTWNGYSVDYDVALAPYWGQSNAVQPKPEPPADPLHYALLTPTEGHYVLRFDGARKHVKYDAYRTRVLQPELSRLAHAIWTAHQRGGSWAYRNRGARFQAIYRRSLGQQLAH